MTDTATTLAAIRAFKAMSASSFDKWTSWAFSRALVEYRAWHVPVDADHRLLPMPMNEGSNEGSYVVAVTDPANPAVAGLTLAVMPGRVLYDQIADDITAIAFERGTPDEQFIDTAPPAATTRYWRDIAALEEALRAPEPGHAVCFLALGWIVATHNDVVAVDDFDGLRVVHLFTAPDEASRFNATPALDEIFDADPDADTRRLGIMPGRELWPILAANNGIDAFLVNRGLPSEAWLGPEFARLLPQGIDDRPCARVLPARSIAEIHLYLDLAGVTSASREHQLEYAGEALVARYSGETREGALRSFLFEPVMPQADPLDLGHGVSGILCGAALADLLGRLLNQLDAGTGDTAAAATALRWANELLKMIPADMDVLPRSMVRSIFGARMLREAPEIATRAWMDAAREMARGLVARSG